MTSSTYTPQLIGYSKPGKLDGDLIATLILNSYNTQTKEIAEYIAADEDIVVVGASGSGQSLIVENATLNAGFNLIQIDCLRVRNPIDLIQLLEIGFQKLHSDSDSIRIVSPDVDKEQRCQINQSYWEDVRNLIQLIQEREEKLDERVVIVFKNFSHISLWSKDSNHYDVLTKISDASNISYAIIVTFGEFGKIEGCLKEEGFYENVKDGKVERESALTKKQKRYSVFKLGPISDAVLGLWVDTRLNENQLRFSLDGMAKQAFLDYVKGSFSDALCLIKRLQYIFSPRNEDSNTHELSEADIDIAVDSIFKDLSTYFETLILSLPSNQVRLLERLSLNPTAKPFSKDFVAEHCLPSGGSLQNAINALIDKGLIYSPKKVPGIDTYRVALPLLAEWINRQGLSRVSGS